MNAIAPVWDGNETWLVLGGGGLMAAFPLAFAVHACRRSIRRSSPCCSAWCSAAWPSSFAGAIRGTAPSGTSAFTAGSIVAALAQGIILGALLQGSKVERRAYGGGVARLADAVQLC